MANSEGGADGPGSGGGVRDPLTPDQTLAVRALADSYFSRATKVAGGLVGVLGLLGIFALPRWVSMNAVEAAKDAVARSQEKLARVEREVEERARRAHATLEDLERRSAAADTLLREVEATAARQQRSVAEIEEMIRSGAREEVARRLAGGEFRSALLAAAMPVPVGSVLAWPSAKPPDGWAICNGDSFADASARERGWNVELLREALGGQGKNPYGDDRLPDYRGLFLRGVDDPDGPGGAAPANRDVDAAARLRPTDETTVMTGVGSFQPWSTGPPRSPFSSDSDGAHSHAWPGTGYGTSPGDGGGVSLNGHWEMKDHKKQLVSGGAHSHAIRRGGDSETRPVNSAVNWIIKVR